MTRVQRGISGVSTALVALAAVGLVAVATRHRAPDDATTPPATSVVTLVPATPALPVAAPSAPVAVSAATSPPAPSAPQVSTGREAAVATTPVTAAPSPTTSPRSGLPLSLDITAVAADGSVTASITARNPNTFSVDAVEISAQIAGSAACELTADFPTSLQIGPSVTVPVEARGSVTVTATCALASLPLDVVISASAAWDDRRVAGRGASASATLDLAP